MGRHQQETARTCVFALDTCGTATADGLSIALHAGDPWAADDPFVRSRPELFGPWPPERVLRRSTPAPDPSDG